MYNIEIGDIIMFREGHKNEGKPGRIESQSETGSFNVRMANGTVCGAYPEDIYKLEEQTESSQIYHNNQDMKTDELTEIIKSKGFKITIAIIIVIVTFFYFRGHNLTTNLEQSPIDKKIWEISQKELSKGNEYKIQKDSRDSQRSQKKIEQESIARVNKINEEIGKLKKEVMDLIK